VRDSYFYNSRSFGPGQGYGVAVYSNSSANLIEDNIFETLHVSMQANYGASGNVFGYNYALGGKADSGNAPSMSFHGTHSYMNLFEGNYGAMRVEADVVHGSSSHQLLFRNRLTGYEAGQNDDQTAVEFDYYNRRCSAVGNVLGTLGVHKICQRAEGATCSSYADKVVYKLGYVNPWGCDSRFHDSQTVNAALRHSNWDPTTTTNHGIVTDPTISDLTLPNSYYLASKPIWFGNLLWPPFDPYFPTRSSVTNIPAGYRYTLGIEPPSRLVPPPLTISASGPNVVLSWQASSPGFSLQYTTNLESVSWTHFTAAAVIVNGQNIVTNPISSTPQFFRLSQ
jgi:hypothetical protein